MSKLEVDAIEPQSGTTLTIGASGDSVNIASGATITGFKSTGITDNATANAITIGTDETVTIVKKLVVDTDTLVVDNTNNRVGIGITSPAYKLDIQGTDSQSLFIKRTDASVVGGLQLQDYSTGGLIRTVGAKEMRFDTNSTERMRITSTGNVGIGTSSPDENLHIFNGSAGSVTANNAAQLVIENSGDAGINILSPNTQDNWLMFGDAEDNFIGGLRYNHPSNFLSSYTNNAERIRITSGGGVNVGSGVISAASNDGDVVVGLGVVVGTYNGDNRIAASSLGGGSATLYIGNAAIQVSSDRRLKTNIADTTMSAIDKIKQVRIVDFNWNDPSDTSYNNRNARGTWTGVIAQELIDVFPFAVNAPRKEEDLSIDTESEKKWQVDQAHLVPVLMKAIQEQQTKIEQLENRITALENK